jgi:hypothetical protein
MRPLPDVIAQYIDAYNRKDVDGMVACLAETVRFENRADGAVTATATDKARFADMARAGAALFAERR